MKSNKRKSRLLNKEIEFLENYKKDTNALIKSIEKAFQLINEALDKNIAKLKKQKEKIMKEKN